MRSSPGSYLFISTLRTALVKKGSPIPFIRILLMRFPPLRLPFCIEALNRLRYAWFHRAWNLSFDAIAFASCLQFEESDVLIRRDRAKTKQKRTGVRYLSARLSVHRIGKSFVEVKNYLCFMRRTFFFPPYYVVVIGAYNISPETIRL